MLYLFFFIIVLIDADRTVDFLRYDRQNKVMSENPRRMLRERRNPRYRNSDEDDLEIYGYSKQYYANEIKSPAVQLNSIAKVMVKFVNKINKDVREYKNQKESQNVDLKKKEDLERQKKMLKIDSSVQSLKRGNLFDRDRSHDSVKKSREMINFNKNVEVNKQIRINDTANKMKNNPKQPMVNMKGPERNIYSSQIAEQLSEFQNRYPEFKDFNIQYLNQLGSSPHSLLQQQVALNQHFFFSKDKPKPNESNIRPTSKPLVSQQKLFKRSAYHVAIAYHIYLKKLRQSGVQGNDIDPTYNAKKLKETKNKQDQH